MSIAEHPALGTVLICDFGTGFREPEMVKRRPVIVISPKIQARSQLCTVVALSTTAPHRPMPFNCEIRLDPPLPPPWARGSMWVKGDMIYAVALHRLDLVRCGKETSGRRAYRYDVIPDLDMRRVRTAVLHGLGLSALTKHLPSPIVALAAALQ
jgi:mRNA interferase MazF